MKKIILIGFMGSGKTTLANFLTEALSVPMYCLDDLIVKKAKRNIPEIFNCDGEITFREYEIAVAKDLRNIEKGIIDCGGGVVMNKIILDYLRNKNGIIIYLKTSFETIKKRLGKDDKRPLFKDLKKAKRLYQLRQILYENYADLIVITDDKSVKEVAYEIISQI